MRSPKFLALATLLVTSLAGSAVLAQCKPYVSKISLEPTKLGEAVGAMASAGVSIADDCSELFGVTVSGKFPDGEMLIVIVTSKAGTFQAGEITMFDSVGQLVIESTQVSDVFPVNQLESIQILGAVKGGARLPVNRMMPPPILLEGWF